MEDLKDLSRWFGITHEDIKEAVLEMKKSPYMGRGLPSNFLLEIIKHKLAINDPLFNNLSSDFKDRYSKSLVVSFYVHHTNLSDDLNSLDLTKSPDTCFYIRSLFGAFSSASLRPQSDIDIMFLERLSKWSKFVEDIKVGA